MGNVYHTIHSAAVGHRSPKYQQNQHGLIREAIRLNDLRALGLLLKSVNTPLIADGFARSPFHIACESGASPEIINLLCSVPHSEAYINEQDNEGNTPLHYAVERGQVETIQCMMRHGAYFSINIRN